MIPSPRLDQRPEPKAALRPLQRLIPRLKVARVLSLPEENFGQMVLSIEKNPLSRRFFHTDDPAQRLFGYRRYSRGSLAQGFLELKDEIAPGGNDVDVESLLAEKRDLIALCRRIGRQNFERYFLEGEEGRSPETIARDCGLTPAEVRRLLDLTTQIGVHAEFYSASPAASEPRPSYARIAHFEKDGAGYVPRYTSLRYGRGRYHIDYEKLQSLRKGRAVSSEDWNHLKTLVKSMELVNARRSTVSRILDLIADRQCAFLGSALETDLRDLTQEAIAKTLGVHASTVCRAVAGKSIVTPQGRERPLRDFLGRGSLHGILAALENLVGTEEDLIQSGKRAFPFRDDEIRDLLRETGGWRLAVRTVAKYRSLLGVPNVYERARATPLPDLATCAEPGPIEQN